MSAADRPPGVPGGRPRGPVDPDVDLHDPEQRAERIAPALAAMSAGGVLGALTRHGAQQAFPHAAGEFPWATFTVNVTGCLLIGVLMVVITEVLPHRPLLRPFLGVGVLGGYTTFSAYAVDVQQALEVGEPAVALTYLAGTLAAALLAVLAGTALAGRVVRRRGGSRVTEAVR